MKLSQPAQLHRHTFTRDDGVPPPPLAEGSFLSCIRAWLEEPIAEQPFYFISLEDSADVGYEAITRYAQAFARSEEPRF